MMSRHRGRANLIRRVIRGEEVEEVQLGEVEVDLPTEYIHGEGNSTIEDIAYLTQSPSPRWTPVPSAQWMSDSDIRITQHPEKVEVYLPPDVKSILQIKWGDECFTAIFPIKEEGVEIEHDMPIGRIEWIIEEKIEDEDDS